MNDAVPPRDVYPLDDSVRRRAMRLAIIQGVFSTFGTWLIGGWFLTYFAMELGAKGFMVGVVLAVGQIASILRIFTPSFVNACDNRKSVWLWANLACRIAQIGFPLLAFPGLRPPGLDPLWILVGLLCTHTILTTIGDVVWLSWYADIVPETTWGRYFARRNIFMAIPVIFTTSLGGWAADAYMSSHPEGKMLAYVVVFGLGVLCHTVSMFPLLPVPNLRLREKPERRDIWRDISQPFSDPQFRRYALFWCWLMFASGISQPSFHLYLKNYLGVGLLSIGLIQVVERLFNMGGQKWSGILTDRFGNKPIIIIGLIGAATGPFFWLPTEVGNYGWLYGAYMVWGVGWAGVLLGSQNLMLKVAPRGNNVGYIAAAQGLGGLFQAVTLVLGGIWLDTLLKSNWSLNLFGRDWNGYHLFFMLSWLGRTSAAFLVFSILEPGAFTIRDMLRALLHRKKGPELEVTPVDPDTEPAVLKAV